MNSRLDPGRRRSQVALATAAAVADLDADERAVAAGLHGVGVTADAVVWDDPAARWDAYDLVVVRSTWDYPERLEEFLGWVDTVESVTRLATAGPVLRWNTDKGYLRDLADAGVPVVPTRWLEPGAGFEPPEGGFVVKPAVSAGARNTGRFTAARHLAASQLVSRLHREGRTVMIQPYLAAVDDGGETASRNRLRPGAASSRSISEWTTANHHSSRPSTEGWSERQGEPMRVV